jgi:hypothetical protein
MVVLASSVGAEEQNLLRLLWKLCWGGSGNGGACYHEIATWSNGPWGSNGPKALQVLRSLMASIEKELLARGVSEATILLAKRQDWLSGISSRELGTIPPHIRVELATFMRLCRPLPKT